MLTKFTLLKSLFVIPLVFLLAACGGDGNNSQSKPNTIVDVAIANGNFTTLVAALQATGLDAALDDETATYTVFAPTDAAFELLGQDTINALLADTDTLSDILLYHVIDGAAVDSNAAIAAAGTTVTMANGDNVGLSLSGSDLSVNVSLVTSVNIAADNGLIHVLDAVLIPPADIGTPTANIVDTAIAAGNFTTLVTALQAAGLDSTLADETASFTVFAPTDAAFNLLGAENIAALVGDSDALTAVLLQHVVSGTVIDSVSAYAASGASVTTAGGADIDVLIQNRSLTIGGSVVSTADIYTTNGVIHVIDAVIVGDVQLPSPPMSIVDIAVADGNFTTLVGALQATGLDATLGDLTGSFTVFAPTDAAFAALGANALSGLTNQELSDILLYHVIVGSSVLAQDAIAVAQSNSSTVATGNGDNIGLSLTGSTLQVNTAAVTTPNIMADNGVIHVVDKVLLPPAEMDSPVNNIAEIVVADANFGTLLTALQAASLDSVLADETETFTVFAPTDAAFAKIPADVLNALIADTDTLSDILLQHVVQGAAVDSVTAFTLNGNQATTAGSTLIDINIVNGVLQVGGANVVTYDIYANNGVIHVIDTVIVGDVTLPTP